jgi:hypothetical protein
MEVHRPRIGKKLMGAGVQVCAHGTNEKHLCRGKLVCAFCSALEVEHCAEKIFFVATNLFEPFENFNPALGRAIGLGILDAAEVQLHSNGRRKLVKFTRIVCTTTI